MSKKIKINRRGAMAYVVVRLYSGTGARTAEQLAALAIDELGPKLAGGPGFTRYATIVMADGRYGSFSAYESQDAARRGQQIATEWVKGHSAMQSGKLDETLEGEVIYAEQGSVPMKGGLHGMMRLYTSSAPTGEVKEAFEKEASSIIRGLTGLARYTVAKLTDGRIGIFNSFDTQENARKSSEEAKKLRGTSGTAIGRLLPSDPQIVEGRLIGVYPK
jgi:hypothetical protein